MDYKYIEQLLERYWECETTLREESILRNFFAQDDVPAHLLPYKSVFEAEEATVEEGLSEDFDQRMLSLIGEESPADEGTAPVVKARTIRFKHGLRPFFKAAAVVAMVLSVSMAVQQAMYQGQTQNVETMRPGVMPSDRETAFEKKDISTLPDTAKYVPDPTSETTGSTLHP